MSKLENDGAPAAAMKLAIGERLRRLRKGLQMNEAEFGLVVGRSRGSVNGWELGETFIRPPELERIRKKYGLTADFILFGDTARLTAAERDWLREIGVLEP